MVSAGLTAVGSCNYDLINAIHGRKTMNILCIGHGGGSLPLFLSSKIKGEVGCPVISVCLLLQVSIENGRSVFG